MNAWPVIVRELRAEARRPLNTGLRVLAAGGIIFVFWVVVAASPGEAGKLGLRLFLAIHCVLLAGILILTPLLAGDCLSRERREGTLDLLFLTPLRPVGVIVAKCLVHGLRMGSFILAALPVMALAFLLGGVTWLDFFSALTFEVCALLLALSGVILVSSACSRASVATPLALACASAFMVLFAFLLGAAVLAMLPAVNVNYPSDLLSGALAFPTGTIQMGGWSKLMAHLPAPVGSFWPWFLGGSLLGCGLLFAGTILLAAFQLRRPLQGRALEGTRGRSASWWRREWAVRPLADRARRWKLDYNPMIWLTTATRKHTLFGRGWLLLLALLLMEHLAIGLSRDTRAFHGWLAASVVAALSLQAATSFRGERQDGVIELLLTTSQTARALVWGRVWGLYYLYLPAMLLLSVSFWLTREIDSGRVEMVWDSFFLLLGWGVFLVQPVIGVNSALRLRDSPVAIVYTVFFAGANVLCYLTLFMMAYTFHRAVAGTEYPRLGVASKLVAALPEMGLIDLAVIAILQGLLAWRYITLMNRQLSRSLLAGEIR